MDRRMMPIIKGSEWICTTQTSIYSNFFDDAHDMGHEIPAGEHVYVLGVDKDSGVIMFDWRGQQYSVSKLVFLDNFL